MYSTISVNTTTAAFSTHTELHINQTISSSKSTLAPSFSRTQSLNSSTPTVPLHTMSTSSIPTGMANSSSQASSISTTALSSTHSDNATYSTTVRATERAIQTTQSSNNFSTNSTTTSSLTFSSLIINASTAETKRTNLTSINSTTLQIIKESSTKVIKPTSVVSSVLASSTASPPIASSEKRIVALNVTIVNKVYTSPLANKSSEEYIKLAKEVKDTFEFLFRNTPGFLEVVILGFRNGSVIIDSYVRLQQSSNTTATELGMVITANPNTTNLTFTDINVEELCTSGYCSNHGTCKKISKTQLECSCNTDYTGPRCSSKLIVLKPRDDDDDDEFDEYWIAIGVCIGLFVLIVILLIFLALRRRRKYYVTRESVMSIGRTSGDVFFNPAFGHSREYLADDTQKPSWASSRSSLSTAGSDSGL
ncbi:putative GPI-anchored protein pfl2 [Dendronephthya gigantea]|uniref:putative GPI-anchored protein pfl2 n=1 Tax=Dendronephthya gigantea TaxID=151771 RepID=UPI00106B23DC|nr:putative GPI-anchored protein pfl2 [Dendronephthya gigantea]